MKGTMNQMRLIGVVFLTLLVLVLVPIASAAPNVRVMPPTEKAFGKSYGQWAAAW